MIALWMVYAVVLGALFSLAAAAAERALRLAGRPARAVWAAAMALTLALPTADLLRPATSAAGEGAANGVVLTLDPRVLEAASRSVEGAGPLSAWLGAGGVAAPDAWGRLDWPLAAAWALATLLLAVRAAVAGSRLRRRIRGWPRETLAGALVRVAPDLGPAVFGALRPEILLPRWAVVDARLPLMLAHERAHVRARDPLLLAVGLAAAVLVPWNPAAWWQLRRLRLAVELDCDARVLAAGGPRPAVVRAYGALLLDVAARAPARPPLAALVPTLLATPSTLHRRIDAMTTPRPPRAVRAALPLAAGAAALVAAACELPRPTGPRAEPNASMARLRAPATPDRVPLTRPSTTDDVRNAVRAAMPEALERTRGAKQVVWVVQAADGRITRVVRGTAEPGSPTAMREVTVAELNGGTYLRVSAMAGTRPPLPTLEADAIASVEVHKAAPGRVLPDTTDVIWIRMKGAGAAPVKEPEFIRMRQLASAQERVVLNGGTATVRLADSGGRSGPAALRLRSPGDSAGPKPLYLVDGLEIDGSPASLPKPDRIEAVSVLKGAAALREYGDRGANGVIVITTKRN
jgi:TonB-dependent SusC/RagA subfamily outer membrane receptor